MPTVEELERLAEQRELTAFERGQLRALSKPSVIVEPRPPEPDPARDYAAFERGATRATKG